MSDFNQRFGGIARLYGTTATERLRQARVAVVGIGGVGSWVAEALARTGVGRLTLIDLDEVCVTNVNRQAHAVTNSIGKPKVEAMRGRLLEIHPECEVVAIQEYFMPENAGRLLAQGFDVVVDAIDSVKMKCLLIADAKARRIPVVTVGGAGGRRDPTLVRVVDLAKTTRDPLLAEVRKRLRREHGFAGDVESYGVPCAYSTEPMVYPQSDGGVCDKPEAGERLRMDCHAGYGSASFVTGAFGFAVAAQVARMIAEPSLPGASA